MKEPTLFDVIGPIMIGPSSSHTAGALRISLMAYNILAGRKPKKATFTLYKSFAKTYKGHGTDKALVAGLLGYKMDDIRIRDSFKHAKEQGIDFEFVIQPGPNDFHANTAKVEIEGDDGYSLTLIGESIGGGAAVITKINKVDVRITGEYNTIIVEQYDKPGALAYITSCLSHSEVNIAFANLFRENKGEIAYTVIESDDDIHPDVIESIRLGKNIIDAKVIKVD